MSAHGPLDKKLTIISTGVIAMFLLAAAVAQANSLRVTRGDAEAVFQAFGNGGWAPILNGEGVDQGAPTDFMPDSMARIAPMATWQGRHFCSLDWHVISVAANEGNVAGGTRTNTDMRDTLASVVVTFTLDGAPLQTTTTAIKRTTNPQRIGAVEAFFVNYGRVMAPDDLSLGPHSLRAVGTRPGRPPMLMGPVTFYIDAPAQGDCLQDGA